MKIDEMIIAIERRHCIRKLWRCSAGWGMMFVRDYDEPEAPPLAMPGLSPEAFKENQRTHDRWRRKRKRLEEANSVVYEYYPSVAACVAAEYRERVVNEKGLP